jgi:SAM-dependent methyltransferase
MNDRLSPSDAPPTLDAAQYASVRDVLARAGYTDEGVVKVLGVDSLSRLRDRRLPALLRRTGGGTPLDTLVRMFILDQPVDAEAAARAFAPMTVDDWSTTRLVERVDDTVRPCVQLRCYQGMVLAYDFLRRDKGGVRRDYVMSVSPSTLVLLGMTVRRKNRAALDLGAGCGIQAFAAAGHSDRVVAVDTNPRAIAIGRFNAGLNGIGNVDFREGSMFEPVAGETFDLIVSNPPFIISPDNRHLFLNSGEDDDAMCRNLARMAPTFLNDGGYCIFNANWAVVEGEDWRTRLAGWFAGTGCDAFVVGQGIVDTAEYAASLIEIGDDMPEYLRLFDSWMAYYRARRIASIGRGVIVMQRTGAHENWFDADVGPVELSFPSGEDIRRLIEVRTYLRSLGENGLLDARLRVADNVRLEQTSKRANGAWTPVSGQLRRIDGLAYAGAVDATTAALVAKYDGQRPVRAHIDELAAVLNAPADTITPGALAIIRRLIEQGFLLPDSVT